MRDRSARENIQLIQTPSPIMTADILTKPINGNKLKTSKFEKTVDEPGVASGREEWKSVIATTQNLLPLSCS